MVAYSFKSHFAPKIIAGTKCQTIRADRKRHARPGEEMQLYTGMRTKQCRLIMRVTCESIAPVLLDFVVDKVLIERAGYYEVLYGLDIFAYRDGFDSWADMRAFWREHHGALDQWRGVLITWRHHAPLPS
jgi:hypothetical protein